MLVLASSFTDYMLRLMISYGANGFISRDYSLKDIIKAIKAVYQKNYNYSPIANKPLFTKVLNNKDELQIITPRQIEFLQHCTTTGRYSEIAKAMEISTRTIDNNRDAIFERLKVKEKTDMVLTAVRSGLIFITT